jgi:hypothetical protein
MAQNQNIGLLGQYLTVNSTANSIVFSSNSVNSVAYSVGNYGNSSTGGFIANSTIIAIGNSTVNVVVNTSSVYVSGSALGGGSGTTNVNAQYAWTNTQSFSNTISFNGPLVIANTIAANGVTNVGSSGYVLTSGGTGANVYWAAAASGGFTNGQSIMVSNVAFANSSNVASAYTYYNTTTLSLDTVFV